MRLDSRFAIALVALAVGACKSGTEGEGLGSGPEKDARFVTDLYTWQCQESDGSVLWEGVFDFQATLEYAPDALEPRSLLGPGGCAYGINMFAESAGPGARDIPGVDDEPKWETDELSGNLERLAEGFYQDSAFGSIHTCQLVETLLGSGAELVDAAALTGVATPPPGTIDEVLLRSSGGDWSANPNMGFEFGDEIDVSWDAEGWDEVWIQLRRERDGVALESITCNVTGMDSFTIDEDVWSYATDSLTGLENNVYVGFQNTELVETEDGQKVEVATRAMHVAVIHD